MLDWQEHLERCVSDLVPPCERCESKQTMAIISSEHCSGQLGCLDCGAISTIEAWPYGPPDFHEDVCLLHGNGGLGFCDCKASDASDTEWGRGA